MTTLGRRRRTQGPPPHVVFEALTQPRRSGARPWLLLADDEQERRVLQADPPRHCSGRRCDLPDPTDGVLRHLRRRLNELVNRDLRESFDA